MECQRIALANRVIGKGEVSSVVEPDLICGERGEDQERVGKKKVVV